jgi:hypothetical protein
MAMCMGMCKRMRMCMCMSMCMCVRDSGGQNDEQGFMVLHATMTRTCGHV